MSNITTIESIDPNITGFLHRNFLERATYNLVHDKFGMPAMLPMHEGTKVTMRRIEKFAKSTTPLTEGITPDGKLATYTDVTAQIRQYGDYVTLTDLFKKTSPKRTVMEISDALGDQAGETIDTVERDELMSGTNVRYASGVAARANVAAGISDADCQTIRKTLLSNSARRIREQINAGVKISTSPTPESFIAIGHTDLLTSLESLTGWTPKEEYGSQQETLPDEYGYAHGIRFILTPNGKIWSGAGDSSADVYGIVVLGRSAYANIKMEKRSTQIFVKNPVDPLDQRYTIGWKTEHASKITNDDFMYRLEVQEA